MDTQTFLRSRPGKTKPKKGAKRKVPEFRPFLCEFWCVSFGKTSTIHELNLCSGMPLRKVHEPAFLWFGFARVTPDFLIKFAALSGISMATHTPLIKGVEVRPLI